ncbi:Uncharacterised protein [Yersinia pekkanenii]|uniref:Uncharacterized protein n=1 Tax=Yersinia pekkanenii TaxID=1288385 RepID=A0A0T9QU40_9GAMM|nr:Uncharacterised protein [Yersinia pekkanenii]CRY68259.1 Uncharacterised protein [Yersinia pekkanenii]
MAYYPWFFIYFAVRHTLVINQIYIEKIDVDLYNMAR